MNQNDEWYTPLHVLEKVKMVLGHIDIDPASNAIAQKNVQAKKYFTAENSGLDKDWVGKIWCNPPYSAKLLKHFTRKFAEEYQKGNMVEGIMLTNQGTDTIWNIPLQAGVHAYTNGRLAFIRPDGSTDRKGSRGQLFTYFGPNHKKFIEVFTKDEFCWVPNLHLIG